MKIRSKKTKIVQEVTPEQWENMVTIGISRNFMVISKLTSDSVPEEVVKKPEEISAADFNLLLRKGNSKFKKEQYQEALDIWEKALVIKSTPLLLEKMEEARQKLNSEKDTETAEN